jgi:hypothetical protein
MAHTSTLLLTILHQRTVLGPETLPTMEDPVNKLDSMLPGIRFKGRLMERLKDGASHDLFFGTYEILALGLASEEIP